MNIYLFYFLIKPIIKLKLIRMNLPATSSSSNLPTQLLCQFDCRQGAVRAVRFNVDGNYCMTAGADKSVKLWNPYRHIHLKSYTGLGSEVLDCCGSSDNSLILAGGRDKQPTIFDVESGKMVKRWKSHGGAVNAVTFNEDSSVAISGGQDGLVYCHDVRSRGSAIQILDEAKDNVLCLDVNATEIATGSADGNARIYDLREGRLFVDFVEHSVTAVNLTADNQCLLVASIGGPIRLLEKCSGQLLADYSGHLNKDFRIEAGILTSRNEVVSGSEDGRAYIWDLVDSKLLAKIEHPKGAKDVHSICTHPSKQCMLTASREKIFLWQCPQKEENEEE